MTQYEFLKQQIPSFMSGSRPVFKDHRYVVLPDETWWNADRLAALDTIRRRRCSPVRATIDDVLNAMDAAWKQGPA